MDFTPQTESSMAASAASSSMKMAARRGAKANTSSIVCRAATPADANGLLAFVAKFVAPNSVVCRAFGFSPQDSESLYSPVILAALPDGHSSIAVDESTGEVLGYGIASRWYRDAERNPRFSTSGLTQKAKIFAECKERLRNKFWLLSPPEITCVLRGEASCIRPDYRRMGIARQLFDIPIKDPECAGTLSVTSNYASQCLTAKMGYVTLAELDYASFFAENGMKFEGAFDDERTTKALLEFKPVDNRWITPVVAKI